MQAVSNNNLALDYFFRLAEISKISPIASLADKSVSALEIKMAKQ
jgi:hypothetical protein